MSVYDREGQGITCTVRLHMATRMKRASACQGCIVFGRIGVDTVMSKEFWHGHPNNGKLSPHHKAIVEKKSHLLNLLPQT